MRKIPTLYVRDPEDLRQVLPRVHEDCLWVVTGQGTATRKYDGVCTMLDEDGAWWSRREVKPGKTPPPNWVEVDHDEETGKRTGWEPIAQSSFAAFHAEALAMHIATALGEPMEPGTYELCGPKINRDPESFGIHELIRHGTTPVLLPLDLNYSYASLRAILHDLQDRGIEGIVWHHSDGRMAKLKGRDFPRD